MGRLFGDQKQRLRLSKTQTGPSSNSQKHVEKPGPKQSTQTVGLESGSPQTGSILKIGNNVEQGPGPRYAENNLMEAADLMDNYRRSGLAVDTNP